MFKHISLFLIALLLLAVTIPVFAGSVHKWVDAQGVTHYSDQMPEENQNTVKQVAVTKIDVSDEYNVADNQQDYYSVTNQWARMREERIARKQIQLEKAKIKTAQQPAVPQVVYINQEEPRSSSVYYPAYSAFGNRSFHQAHFKSRFNGNRYSGANCRLPRANSRFGSRSGLRYGGSGLTLTIR